MSRIGRKPVAILDDVTVDVSGRVFTVKGPKGELSITLHPEVNVEVDGENKEVVVNRVNDERESRARHGLTRSLINNMVFGVKNGYEKKLEVVGVGYLCAIAGKVLQLRVGLANELHKDIPDDLSVTCPDQTHIVVQGACKQRVGQFAAEVRALRKPEPYKGKGIRYVGEQVTIKPGKSAT